MWRLLILAGLLAVSAEKEAVPVASEKSESSGADDLVMLEIDIKEPAKRSPITASAVYGASPSQYIIRHGDDAQELSPEYLSLLQQYTQAQPQPYSGRAASPPERRPLPAYAKQQQQLQQAYQNQRVPAVVPPRPRAQLHSQALAQAEAAAQLQAQADAQSRAEALHSARLRASSSNAPVYQTAGPVYSDQKLGTFEQELLQLVAANQAQEFKLVPAVPKRLLKQQAYPQYAQQSASYPSQYVKAAPEPAQAPEQYHIETTVPRYHQAAPAYQAAEEPAQVQYQAVQVPVQAPEYHAKQVRPFRPSPQYPDAEEQGQLRALQQAQAQAEAQAIAQAQAQAEAHAQAYQKIAQASHNKHQEAAFEQIRLVNERHRQQTALEQINQGAQLSEAGRSHLEEQAPTKDPEVALKAQLKAQAQAEVAEARRAQEAAEYKAHADAILHLQAQQQAHVKAQEEAHKNALAHERNQLRAQAQAQALAQAQAEALYKAHQQARAKANNEALTAARAQAEARKIDPENTPVIQYLLPNSAPLPSPNSYFTNDQVQKYQGAGSSYVPRAAPKSPVAASSNEEQTYAQPAINQPRQAHKHKIPQTSQSSIYVTQSGHLKKSPVKSLTIEEIIEQDQLNSPQVVRLPASKGQQPLTQEDLAVLINAGYSVTPVPDVAKPTQQSYTENTSGGYYTKKQRSPVARPEYESYEEAAPRQRRPLRKQRPILKQDESTVDASEKVTYLVPLEPAYGTRQTPLRRTAAAEE
ncbi:mediator of RNA polymerase II transcription subunit 15 [Cephus cinctus]|uniref:Mediator of RNA polymerase II transcription subunit 15 n=1 Tax=Cephus cinctus TaxID=211228 RepID=A0AAJ7FCZ2_CEPCN|nr:mediator of RNA polymerase II transcription subunit 15 [Cephus cinctus]